MNAMLRALEDNIASAYYYFCCGERDSRNWETKDYHVSNRHLLDHLAFKNELSYATGRRTQSDESREREAVLPSVGALEGAGRYGLG